MDNAITNLKLILEAEIAKPNTVLSNFKQVYYGDPIDILVQYLPAIIITDPEWAFETNKFFTLKLIVAYSADQYMQDINNKDGIVPSIQGLVKQVEEIRRILRNNPNLSYNDGVSWSNACEKSAITKIVPFYNSVRNPYTYELIMTFEITALDN